MDRRLVPRSPGSRFVYNSVLAEADPIKKRSIYGNSNDPREIPTYGLSEASRYLSVREATLKSWVLGRNYTAQGKKRFALPLIHLPSDDTSRLSFMNLVEAHVLNAIRKKHQIPFPRIRKAVDYLEKELQSKHPLADERLKTDDIDLFIEQFGTLINVSRGGQLAIRELLDLYLRRIEHDADGLARRIYPFTRKVGQDDPRFIVIDPYIGFGKPIVKDSGVPTHVIGERYKAGDSIEALAEDYELTPLQIQEAIRYEFSPAA